MNESNSKNDTFIIQIDKDFPIVKIEHPGRVDWWITSFEMEIEEWLGIDFVVVTQSSLKVRRPIESEIRK